MTESQLLSLHIGFPRNFIALSRGFTSSHRGIDMCWNSQYGGAYAPVFAPADGEVVAIDDGWGNTWSTGVANWGNYIKIKHGAGVYTLSAHLLKGSFKVKIGDKVKRGQQVAQMNNSGYSNGCHVHYELYWDKNGKGSGTQYRVDPLKYCFAYPDDYVGDEHYNDGTAYHIMRYTPVKRVGTPVDRNKMVNQLEVITDTLNARREAGLKGEVLGYVNQGIYDVHAITEKDGFTWYQIDSFWCANNAKETWCHYLPTEYIGSPVQRNETVNQIQVTATTLRARKYPSLEAEILGFANRGYYDCPERTEADGYKWFSTGQGFWVAQSKSGDWVTWLPKKDPHYNFTMKSLTTEQRDAQIEWCKANNIEYDFTEV